MDLMNDKLYAKPKRPPVGKALKLPNVKTLFLPDEGFIIGDADLAQADARVVAWDADDEILKEIFNDPKLDLHTENAKAIFGSCPTKDHPNRKKAKAGVHAVNYNVYPPTLAATLGITVLEAETFINKWFAAHPKIKEWHQRIYHEMMVNKRIENAFGYGKTFFDARDKPTALSEALAWIPQSTVGNIINFVWEKIEQLDQSKINVMMQVHDSLVFQIRHDCLPEIAEQVRQAFASVVVPYKDPLVISSTLGLGYNCGEVDDVTWDGWVIDPSSGLVTERRLALWPAA